MKKVVLLVAFLLVLFPCLSWGQEIQAVLVKLKGTVLVLPEGESTWIVGRKWMKLSLRSKVKTLSHSYADILINKRALVRIKENTEIELSALSEEIASILRKAPSKGKASPGTSLRLLKGKAFLLIAPGYHPLPFVVETPIGIAGVAGTKFVVDLDQKRCLVAVWRGRVLFWNPRFPEKKVLIEAGFFSQIVKGAPPSKPAPIGPELKRRYQDIRQLYLGNMIDRLFFREPGSRYHGMFSRGYSPTVSDGLCPTMSSTMSSTSMSGQTMDSGTMSSPSGMGGSSMGGSTGMGGGSGSNMSGGSTSNPTSPSSKSPSRSGGGCGR